MGAALDQTWIFDMVRLWLQYRYSYSLVPVIHMCTNEIKLRADSES
jgi:hypothetical protein